MEHEGGQAVLIAMLAIYFLPFIIASSRNHHNRTAIGVLNLLLGWSVIAWIVALIWACTAVRPDLQRQRMQPRDWVPGQKSPPCRKLEFDEEVSS